MMKKIFITCLWVLVSRTAGADIGDPFDVNSQSVRSLGSGGAYTSIADDASAFTINPAGVGRHREEINVFVQNQFEPKPKEWNLRAGFADGKTEDPLAFGFSFNTVHLPSFKKEDYSLSSAFNFRDYFLIGVSQRFTKFHPRPNIPNFWLFAMDAGILAFPTENISVGASILNPVRTRERSDLAPVRSRVGVSINFKNLRLGGDFERNFSQRFSVLSGGLEYSMVSWLQARGGYVSDVHGLEKLITYGVSLTVPQRFSLDFSGVKRLERDFWVMAFGISFRV